MYKVMTDIAQSTGCRHTEFFSQNAAIKENPHIIDAIRNERYPARHQDICFGLAFVWLEYQAHKSRSDFFFDIHDRVHSTALLKAVGINAIEQFRKVPLMAPEWPSEDMLKHVALFCGFSFPYPRDHFSYIHTRKSWQDCVEFMQKGYGQKVESPLPRYFIFLYGKVHAMAGCARENGTFEFFDPNAGLTVSPNATAMANFLHYYLAQYKKKLTFSRQIIIRVYRMDVRKIFT